MRSSGLTLREIGEKTGISRQRVSRILKKYQMPIRYKWLSSKQVCIRCGITPARLKKLKEAGIVRPLLTRTTPVERSSIWSPNVTKEIHEYTLTHNVCQICGNPIPRRCRLFCSKSCYTERHKYKNMTPEEKQKIRNNVKRYRERKTHPSLSKSRTTDRDANIEPVIKTFVR